jgi:hypothetical protein
MQSRHLVISFLVAALVLAGNIPAKAATNPLADCVDLGADHQTTHFASQYLLVEDGNAHYRVSFNRACEAIRLPSQATISTDGQVNRLCPSNTRVASRSASCKVRGVDQIDAESYARYKRLNR